MSVFLEKAKAARASGNEQLASALEARHAELYGSPAEQAPSIAQQTEEKTLTRGEAIGQSLVDEALPTLGGFAGAGAGASLLAPLGPVGMIAGALAGGFGGGALTRGVQEKVVEGVSGKEGYQALQEKRQQGREQYPISTLVAENAPSLLFARPNLSRTAQGLTGKNAYALTETGIGAAIGAGSEGARQMADGEFDAGRLLTSTAIGAINTDSTALGRAVGMDFQAAGGQKAATAKANKLKAETEAGAKEFIANESKAVAQDVMVRQAEEMAQAKQREFNELTDNYFGENWEQLKPDIADDYGLTPKQVKKFYPKKLNFKADRDKLRKNILEATGGDLDQANAILKNSQSRQDYLKARAQQTQQAFGEAQPVLKGEGVTIKLDKPLDKQSARTQAIKRLQDEQLKLKDNLDELQGQVQSKAQQNPAIAPEVAKVNATKVDVDALQQIVNNTIPTDSPAYKPVRGWLQDLTTNLFNRYSQLAKADKALGSGLEQTLLSSTAATRALQEDTLNRIKVLLSDADGAAKRIGQTTDNLNRMVEEYTIARQVAERDGVAGEGSLGASWTKERAAKVIAETEALDIGRDIKGLSDAMVRFSEETLAIKRDSGAITQEQFNEMRAKFKNHTPLLREIENEGVVPEPFVIGRKMKADTGIRQFEGSEKDIGNLYANLLADRINAIKVKTKQTAFNDVLTQITGNAELGRLFDVSQLKNPAQKNAISGFINGEKVFIGVKDNDLYKILNAMDSDAVSGIIQDWVAPMTRMLGKTLTSWNPAFIPTQIIYDIGSLLINAGRYGMNGKQLGIAGRAFMKELGALRANRAGKGIPAETLKLINQAREDGALIGGMFDTSMQSLKGMVRHVERQQKNPVYRGITKALENVEDLQSDLSNSFRLSVYEEALKAGKTRKEAAEAAREVQTNFIKSGRWSPTLGAVYLFFNASVRGAENSIKSLILDKAGKVSIGKLTTAMGIMLGGAQAMASINDAVDPDWREKNASKIGRNFVIAVAPDKFVYIPVPWEIRPLWGIARAGGESLAGNAGTATDALKEAAISAFDSFNPTGGSADIVASLVPTIVRPLVAGARNQTQWGTPIESRRWDLDGIQPSQRFTKRLEDDLFGRIAIPTAGALSDIGFEVSPTRMAYVMQQYLGGVGKLTREIEKAVSGFMNGEEVGINNIPIANRYFGEFTEDDYERLGINSNGKMSYAESQRTLSELKTKDFIQKREWAKELDKFESMPLQQKRDYAMALGRAGEVDKAHWLVEQTQKKANRLESVDPNVRLLPVEQRITYFVNTGINLQGSQLQDFIIRLVRAGDLTERSARAVRASILSIQSGQASNAEEALAPYLSQQGVGQMKSLARAVSRSQ